MKISRFFLLICLVELVLILIGYLFSHFLILQRNFAAVGIATLVAFIPTFIAYTITLSGIEKETSGFIGRLLGGMLVKMLIGILAIVFVALQFRELRDEFVVSYMISYFVFTGFEVYGLMRNLGTN